MTDFTKTCSKCQTQFPATLEFFYKYSRGKYGLQAYCKSCYRAYYIDNREAILKQHKEYKDANREAILKQKKEYRQENKEAIREYDKQNRKKINEYRKQRRLSDPQFKIKDNLASKIRRLVKKGGDKFEELIGCTPNELRSHLEKQFKPGMTWENHGRDGWHIDHILPYCSFDLTNPEQQKECCHYKNCQPLWAKDNISKAGRYGPERSDC